MVINTVEGIIKFRIRRHLLKIVRLDALKLKLLEYYSSIINTKNKYLKIFISLFLFTSTINFTTNAVNAAQGDKIITVITSITQDFYDSFIYLSTGFLITICVYHLICVIFTSSDDQRRKTHIHAIGTALLAWIGINTFIFLIYKIFALTGQNSLTDIFDSSSYSG